MKVTKKLVDHMVKTGLTHAVVRPDADTYRIWARHCAKALLSGELPMDEYAELAVGPALAEFEDETLEEEGVNPMTVSARKMFGNGNEEGTTGRVRVKSPSEGLSEKRYVVKHAKTGLPVFDEFGREAMSPSEKSLAMAGVTLKLSAKKSGLGVDMTEWEKSLLDEMIREEQWASYGGDAYENKIYSGGAVKALLDDVTSGGIEAAPISFDSDVIASVLLTGELFPFVDIKPVSRGRRVEGASVGHPTLTWGTGEGTEGGLQDFTDYVAAVDTSIYPCTCFCEVGRDFLSDSAVDLGAVVVAQVAEKMAEEMDKVVAVGNGTTQPEGVMNKSGTTGVIFGGAHSLEAWESLLFSVPKQYRKNPANSFVFCGTETSYMRMRGMPVGTTDARRLFGMTHEDYVAFPPRPFKVNESLTNAQLFAGDLKRYRMYRRLGLATEWSTEGKSLLRANTALLACRFRYGGKVVLPAAFGTVTDAPV